MGDLSFHALDLDGTYHTLEKINQLAISDGNMLIENLKKLVLDLKNHWIGNDATIHINNLIKIYDSVRNVVQNVNLVAHNTSEPIVNAQTIRNANGGAGEVDKIIPIENGKSDTIEILQSTKEYYVDPVLVPQDLVDLQVQKDAFNNFCTKFSGYKDELLNKWAAWIKSGALASEMETASLYVASSVLNLKSGAVLLTVWNQEREKEGLDNNTDFDVSKEIKVAIKAIEILIKNNK